MTILIKDYIDCFTVIVDSTTYIFDGLDEPDKMKKLLEEITAIEIDIQEIANTKNRRN